MTNDEFSEIIRKLGGTKKAAQALGVSESTVSQYKSGRRTVGNKVRARINQALSTLSFDQLPLTQNPNARILTDSEVVWIPLYERRINAGKGIDLDTQGVLKAPELRSKVPHPDKTFAVMVSGDSMAAYGITEESIVTCERVESGNIDHYVNRVVLAGYEGAAYIKLLIKKQGRYYLKSVTNPPDKYEDIDLDPKHEWRIFAVMLHYTTRG